MSEHPLIPENLMRELARETLIREFAWAMRGDSMFATEESKQEATEFIDRVEKDGKLYELLDATAEKPCPTCGRAG